MQPLTALLILVACQCLYAHQHPRTPRHHIKDTLHALIGNQSKPVHRIVSCTRKLGVPKCVGALGVWRAERALRSLQQDSTSSFNLTEDVEEFPWKKYTNETNKQIQEQLLDNTQRLLQYRSMSLDMISGYSAKLTSKKNRSLCIDFYRSTEDEGRSSMKKIQKEFYKIAPILLLPGLLISALLPFVLPSLKMMVLMVGFMNQMALVGAIFTILRNNAFNDKYDHKVIYVNSGYENEKLQLSPSNNEEHFHTDHVGILYDDYKTRSPIKPIVNSHFEDNFGDFEEMSPVSVNPKWIKDYTDGKMIAMLRKQPNDDLFFNGGMSGRRSKIENVN
ncbi:unnamed protein product [Arctia plantaginis]|uniref:Uncharacterized protein n=1 Tax=Arctia plantaginis TaxID=874455 RepID=A0A8S1AN34_ARCPL|nr:unnamed protein product [Arctia plantaginis]CAB3247590.1 unnamed protein product [Arctia plantaginis]